MDFIKTLRSYHLREKSASARDQFSWKTHFAVSSKWVCQCKFDERDIWVREGGGSDHNMLIINEGTYVKAEQGNVLYLPCSEYFKWKVQYMFLLITFSYCN